MAAQTGCLIQDQKFNVHLNASLGKEDFVEQKKKVGRAGGGRKPLGDLSNSMKPSFEQAGRRKTLDKVKSKNFTIVDEEGAHAGTAKVKNSGRTKGTVSKASKISQTGNRKALTDISNSRIRNSIRPSDSARQPLYPSAIAEERFLHNHQECVKSQCKDMDVGEFLKIVGHDSVTHLGTSLELVSESVKLKPESHLKHWELDENETPEPLIEVQSSWKQKLYNQHGGSPTPCKTPKSIWKSCDVNFKLMETPQH
ncbi:hypothetical protein L6164_033157 [Bauhinia variegata]|uniref:Uncharacterized protein n=1 Tax=Bauhinia variegata TaxID=167791 RepID=A0ACB9KR02_BAUVA|nr:hypothetical protein L6164_033157 [Bauhinia variegata]